MDVHTYSDEPPRSLAARLHVNQRTLQIALGLIWILDGLLKFQPDLFRPSFVSDVIRPMAVGQPTLLASAINHMANFLSHEATMWVAVFGLIEIGIGVAMLFRRAVKPALVISFIWGIGIALFGEGLGMVLTGDTSPLTGTPGAVCFYVLLGVMVWPKSRRTARAIRAGAASSAAGRGVFGGTGALLAWAALWAFEAIIWMFPFNRTGDSISNQMATTASGEPGWYGHFLHSFGQAFTGAGVWIRGHSRHGIDRHRPRAAGVTEAADLHLARHRPRPGILDHRRGIWGNCSRSVARIPTTDRSWRSSASPSCPWSRPVG